MRRYDDIKHLTRPQYNDLPQMSIQDRAAQFSPFAALTGFEDAVRETARFTDTKRELADDEIEAINDKLLYLLDKITEKPEIALTYFVQDERKDGGSYVCKVGNVRRLDEYTGTLIFTDRTKVPVADISNIEILINKN